MLVYLRDTSAETCTCCYTKVEVEIKLSTSH